MITIGKNELLNALTAASKAVSNKSTMPILECVCMRTTGSSLILETTNMEFSIRKEIPCISDEETVCVNAKRLLEILKKMPDMDIILEISATFVVTLRAGKKIKFEIPGESSEHFPKIIEEIGEQLIISADDLKEAITGIAFCTSTNEANKIMTGIQLKATGNKVSFCGLDGHRIGLRTITISNSAEKEYDIIIPAEYLAEIVKILPEEEVEITINNRNIMFKVSDTVITTRLIEGKYFNVNQIIPQNSSTTSIEVNREELCATVDRALLVLNDGMRRPVIYSIKANEMKVTGTSTLGKAEEEVEISNMQGTDIRVGFNPKYIIDMLKAIPDETITIEFFGQKAPAIIRKEDNSYLYLVLPVNIPD